ncbi:MAG TPA: hypothetical protein VN885_00600 [Candidatus Acidoferrales bacterium]|nr:hypothetical protein [Candidatus Acidoferrales bacterium]
MLFAISARPSRSQEQPSPPAQTRQPDVAELHFDGEVTRGQSFTRDVGHNLTFRLTPATSDEGGGWVIEILPPIEPAGDPVEFAAIATPPYHAYNDRYIAAAFGYSAREALESPLRKFNFVQSIDDEQRASEVVNAALYPSTIGEADKPRVAAEAAALRLGTGQLHIVKSRITSGKDGAPDVIASVKFEVVLNFAPGLTLQQVLAPHPPAPKR